MKNPAKLFLILSFALISLAARADGSADVSSCYKPADFNTKCLLTKFGPPTYTCNANATLDFTTCPLGSNNWGGHQLTGDKFTASANIPYYFIAYCTNGQWTLAGDIVTCSVQ